MRYVVARIFGRALETISKAMSRNQLAIGFAAEIQVLDPNGYR